MCDAVVLLCRVCVCRVWSQTWLLPSGPAAGATITRAVRPVNAGARALSTRTRATANLACWEINSAAGDMLYFQYVVSNADGSYTCTPLPLITTVTKNLFWKVAPLGHAPAPAVRPNLTNGKVLLGILDTVFLISYAAGLFVSGHIGDKVNLRWFLALGMCMSGVFVAMLGMGYYWHIHKMWFYVLVYLIQGIFQSIGWPSVVGVVGR